MEQAEKKNHSKRASSIPGAGISILVALIACMLQFTAASPALAGSLTVTISPTKANHDGARWRRSGTLTWFRSGFTETGIPEGACEVEFIDLRFWTEPAPQTVTITDAKPSSLNVVFTECGDLKVTISPDAAIAGGAKWRRTGTTTWYSSGYVEAGVPVGMNTVEFKSIPGFTKPKSNSIKVSKGKNFGYLSASYTPVTTGGLSVTIAPSGAVTAGARWRRIKPDGTTTAWFQSGYTETRIPEFTYQIEFSTIAGWNTPAKQSIYVPSGDPCKSTGTYIRQTGTLQAVINPPGAISAGARWSTDGGATWLESGTTLVGLTPGPYTITYSGITGWDKPKNQTVSLPPNGSASAEGTYVQQPGTIQVIINPAEAVAAGARWSIDSGASWHAGGETLVSMSPGEYTAIFSDISGWIKPGDQSITLTLNGCASVSGAYVLMAGSLQVSIIPAEAVNAGAQWSIDDGQTWKNCGETVTVAPGTYTIKFKDVQGYGTPIDQVIPLEQGDAITTIGFYITTWYQDHDGDGFGNSAVSVLSGQQPEGYVLDSTDCNDNDSLVFPGAQELCNGKDDNCNGQIDESAGSVWYRDADGDGYGTPLETMLACAQPAGYVAEGTDCDDSNPAVHPNAAEILNGADDNCNGSIDEGLETTSTVPVTTTAQPTTTVPDTPPTTTIADTTTIPVTPPTTTITDNTTVPTTTTTAVDAGTTTTVPVYDCTDMDGDGYGEGASCLGPDCDDSDPEVHEGCTDCTVDIFPRHVSKLFSLVNPFAAFLIWKPDKTSFDQNTVISWENGAITTLGKFYINKKRRVMCVIVFIRQKELLSASEYGLKVSGCTGRLAIRQF